MQLYSYTINNFKFIYLISYYSIMFVSDSDSDRAPGDNSDSDDDSDEEEELRRELENIRAEREGNIIIIFNANHFVLEMYSFILLFYYFIVADKARQAEQESLDAEQAAQNHV